MSSETTALEFTQNTKNKVHIVCYQKPPPIKTEKIRHGWYVIRNYPPRISFKQTKNKVRMVCYQKLPP